MPVRVLQELQQAVEQEDYAKAAELRDSGCAGLLGWWHSRAEDDPVGHILRIAPDFGRYTAVKYTAQDLAELKVPFKSTLLVCNQSVVWPLAIETRQQQQLSEHLQTCSFAWCLIARSLSTRRCPHCLGSWTTCPVG